MNAKGMQMNKQALALKSKARCANAAGALGARARKASHVARAKPTWLPGEPSPEWLDGSLPGDYGFDPFKLGVAPKALQNYREAELIHARGCMLAAAGMMGVELFGFGNWLTAPVWAIEGGQPTYFGVTVPFSLSTIIGLEFVLMAGAEALRNNESDPVKRLYPGGPFDPLGFAKDPAKFEELKVKEIKNGRLAMVAVAGFFAQGLATGNGPITDLANHLGDPWHINIATNGVS